MSQTAFALTGFVSWALFLLLIMEVIRAKIVMNKELPANGFNPDNSNLSPFMQRLARAHANCIEGLPIFGGIMLVAIVTKNTAITDPLALIFLVARIAQSSIHLASTSELAVTSRFTAFTAQMVIGTYWAYNLLTL